MYTLKKLMTIKKYKIMKIRNSKLFFILVSLFFAFAACEDEFELPYNQNIEAEESGLPGLWEAVSVQKEFAKTLQDEFGNTINDDKNRPLWKDTTVVITASESEYTEFIQFNANGGINTFTANDADTLDPDGNLLPANELLNMPLTSGEWTALITIDPSGQNDDVKSVNLYDPQNMHNPLSSIVWTLKKVDDQELVVEYSFGETSYDTLFMKTFRKR